MTCSDVRPLLGVYVLGKADPRDRAVVDEHMPTCPRCRQELAELEGLPALLALIPSSAVGRSRETQAHARRVEVSPDQLPRLLAAAASTRSRRRWLSLTAAALLFIAVGLGALALATRQPPAQTAPAAVATWIVTDSGTGTRATVTLAPRPSGTAIDLTLSGVPAGTRCNLVVTAIDGTASSAASWEADYAGTATVTGFTATPMGQIHDLAIVTTAGHTLARVIPAAIPRSASPGHR